MEQTEMKKESGFDKEAWMEQKQADRKEAFDLIDVTADSMCRDAGLFQSCLDVMARFDRYSVGNVLLVASQNPNATRLADFATWKKEDVSIKKGEKSMLLLEPGKEYTKTDGTTGVNYNTKRVFDISQTDAEPVPQEKQYEIRQLVKALFHTGACQAEIRDDLPGDKLAVYDSQRKRILLRRGTPGDENLFRAYSCEMTMAYLDTVGNALRKDSAFTAMCSSYVVCRRFGLDTSSFNFRFIPDQCGDMDAKEMRSKLKEIRECAVRICGDMTQYLEKAQKQPKSTEAR